MRRRFLIRRIRLLRRARSGVALMEFALVLPVMLTMGLFGTEIAWMTMVNMQMSQVAIDVADNASRLGQTDNSAVTPTVTEAQIDSVMTGAMLQGSSFNLQSNGRIILSSLEKTSDTSRQYIHWQRCRGSLARSSAYGVAGTGKTGTTLAGMGRSGAQVTAPSSSIAVMYVELYYRYQPLFGSIFISASDIYREAAMIVRDDRDLRENSTPPVTTTTGYTAQSSCT